MLASNNADDPTEDYPQWSRTLLLLIDYAIIEGDQRRLAQFVSLLELARNELEVQVSPASFLEDTNKYQ